MTRHPWMRLALMAVLLAWGLGSVHAAPAGQRFVVTKQVLRKQSATPGWSFKYAYPSVRKPGALMGMAGNVRDLNARLARQAQEALASFERDATKYPYEKGMPAQSEMTASYEVVSNTGDYLGVRFQISTFWAGGAHPYGQARTVNWLSDGTLVTLDSMFKPGSKSLDMLSRVCRQKAELQVKKQGFEVSAEGLAPRAKNFQSFVATKHGLVFTFDQGSIGPSAAGMVTLTVPWADLSSMLSPTGKRVREQF